MPRYYLVQYVHRADGCWVSPPECEGAWDEGCFFQTRFDPVSGLGLVTCLGLAGLPAPAVEKTLDEGLAWLAGLTRLPKSGPGPSQPMAPVVLMTLDEEQAAVRRVALGWTNADMLKHAMRARSL